MPTTITKILCTKLQTKPSKRKNKDQRLPSKNQKRKLNNNINKTASMTYIQISWQQNGWCLCRKKCAYLCICNVRA